MHSILSLNRSQIVQHGKKGLLGLAALLGVTIVAVASFNSGENSSRVLLSNTEEKKRNAPPVMVNPRYYGVDSKNRPFTVSASNAMQNKDGTVVIEQVNADMLVKEQSWLALTAKNGIISKNGDEIVLTGSVNMFYEGGYEFRSEYAKVLPNEGRTFGNLPIEGQGPSGTLQADGFDVTDNGQVLHFRKNVRVTLYLE